MTNVLLIVLTILYPFIVYFSLDRLEPRYIALGILLLYTARLIASRSAARKRPNILWTAVLGGLFAMVVFALNSREALLYYPVFVNAGLLVVFVHSLYFPPSAIEHIARLREPRLPASGVAYTRKVTVVWALFFVVNGTIAWVTATFGSIAAWSLYNGFIAYVLMGALFAAEFIVRRRVRSA